MEYLNSIELGKIKKDTEKKSENTFSAPQIPSKESWKRMGEEYEGTEAMYELINNSIESILEDKDNRSEIVISLEEIDDEYFHFTIKDYGTGIIDPKSCLRPGYNTKRTPLGEHGIGLNASISRLTKGELESCEIITVTKDKKMVIKGPVSYDGPDWKIVEEDDNKGGSETGTTITLKIHRKNIQNKFNLQNAGTMSSFIDKLKNRLLDTFKFKYSCTMSNDIAHIYVIANGEKIKVQCINEDKIFDSITTIAEGKTKIGSSFIVKQKCLKKTDNGRTYVNYGGKKCGVEVFHNDSNIQEIDDKIYQYILQIPNYLADYYGVIISIYIDNDDPIRLPGTKSRKRTDLEDEQMVEIIDFIRKVVKLDDFFRLNKHKEADKRKEMKKRLEVIHEQAGNKEAKIYDNVIFTDPTTKEKVFEIDILVLKYNKETKKHDYHIFETKNVNYKAATAMQAVTYSVIDLSKYDNNIGYDRKDIGKPTKVELISNTKTDDVKLNRLVNEVFDNIKKTDNIAKFESQTWEYYGVKL